MRGPLGLEELTNSMWITKDEPLKLELQHSVKCVREKANHDGQRRIRETRADLAFEITRQVQAAKT